MVLQINKSGCSTRDKVVGRRWLWQWWRWWWWWWWQQQQHI